MSMAIYSPSFVFVAVFEASAPWTVLFTRVVDSGGQLFTASEQ